MRPAFGHLSTRETPVYEPLVVAIDPGISTGFAVWSPSTLFIDSGQRPSLEVLDELTMLFMRMQTSVKEQSRLVVENYIIPIRSVTRNEEASRTLRVIGAVEWIAHQAGVESVHLQLPAERTVISMAMLKRWGWVGAYEKVGRDAFSAMQHLGSYLLQTGVVPDRRRVVG